MLTFLVTIKNRKTEPYVTSDGRFAEFANFMIHCVEHGQDFTLEAFGCGALFDLRCKHLENSGAVRIKSMGPPSGEASIAWKTKIVNEALDMAMDHGV